MRVKVGDRWYDSEKTPLMVQLDPGEKALVENMGVDDSKLAVFPESLKDSPDLESWMEVGAPTPERYRSGGSLADHV